MTQTTKRVSPQCWLKAFRRINGFTVKETCDMFSISKSTLYRYESGEATIPDSILNTIKLSTDISDIDYLTQYNIDSLKSYKAENGLTLQELGDMCGLSHKTMWWYTTSRALPVKYRKYFPEVSFMSAEDFTRKSFSEKFAQLRSELKLTQIEFAKQFKMSPAHVCQLERGTQLAKSLSIDTIKAMVSDPRIGVMTFCKLFA